MNSCLPRHYLYYQRHGRQWNQNWSVTDNNGITKKNFFFQPEIIDGHAFTFRQYFKL
jgi:hypothetical protein